MDEKHEIRKALENELQPFRDELQRSKDALHSLSADLKASHAHFVRGCDTVLDKLDALVDRKFSALDVPTRLED